MKLPIYLDYAATTPVDPFVAATMSRYLTSDGVFGNPASLHVYGQAAKAAVDVAREQVAHVIQAEPSEIIWTSGATESNNLALKGATQLYQQKGKHIITLKTEHAAVLDCCQELEKQGFFVTYLSPQKNGLVDLDELQEAIRPDTILMSIMQVNNELGVVQPIQEISQITAEKGILFHVDAAQSIGKIALTVKTIPIDLIALSSHKIYGPKGIGALYIRRKPRVRVAAQLHGGGQEQGMRSGTLATHQIVGMGAAFELAEKNRREDYEKIKSLRDIFWQGLQSISGISSNTDFKVAVPHILNIVFPKFKAAELIQRLPELAVSAGSACHAKGVEPSQVLRAIGLTADEAGRSLRFSFGRYTTQDDVEQAVQAIHQIYL